MFWIVDNGSSHRGHASVVAIPDRFSERAGRPLARARKLAESASWLNQIEIYFSILQRKALTLNDFASPSAVEERLLGFQVYYERGRDPFRMEIHSN